MNKKVVIHQPDFLPYLGFFHRLLDADLLIFLDHIQFTKGSGECWTYRDKIKTPQGPKWLTLSLQKNSLGTAIEEIFLSPKQDWKIRHLNQIKENYRKAPYFDELMPHLEELYAIEVCKMADFNIASIRMLFVLLDIKVETVNSSTLAPKNKKNEMLIDLLQKVGATQYLSGIGAKDYFEAQPFDHAKIEVIWQNFIHPTYPQIHGPFVPYLSSVDLLFNVGIDKARKILRAKT